MSDHEEIETIKGQTTTNLAKAATEQGLEALIAGKPEEAAPFLHEAKELAWDAAEQLGSASAEGVGDSHLVPEADDAGFGGEVQSGEGSEFR